MQRTNYSRNYQVVLSVGLTGVALFMAACIGVTSMAQPSRKSIKLSDIAGNYFYPSTHLGKDVTVTVELSANGYFTITGPTANAGFGTWKILKNNDLSFTYKSKPASMTGWFITDEDNGNLEVMGGDTDPDTWRPLHRLDK